MERLPSAQIFKKVLMSFLLSVWSEKGVCVCMWEVHYCFSLCANLARPGLNAEEWNSQRVGALACLPPPWPCCPRTLAVSSLTCFVHAELLEHSLRLFGISGLTTTKNSFSGLNSMNQPVFQCCFREEAQDWKDQKSLSFLHRGT